MGYEITEAMTEKSKLPGYANAMAACWGTAAAALQAQALATLWRVELTGEPGGKEDTMLLQRNCALYDVKKWHRNRTENAQHAADGAYIDAYTKWQVIVGDDDADWEDWPGGARDYVSFSEAPGTTWQCICSNAWRRAQATFDEQSAVMAPFCEGCKAASKGNVDIQQVEIVGAAGVATQGDDMIAVYNG